MLEEFLKTWEGILDKNGVTLKWQCDPDIVFTCFEFDVENIISNLISNSMASFDRETGEVLEKKEIILTISSEETGFLIDYKDTGWGLLPKYKENLERIMEAFESSKRLAGEEEDGTGMGMWIVAQTALEYSGAWDLSENLRHDTGFYIKISLGG
jgi:sensor histidine kinase regulating citrate/malate metabolism